MKMKRRNSKPEEYLKEEYMRYVSVYMKESGLSDDDLHQKAYEGNPKSANGIVECYKKTNDRGDLEDSIIVFIDCYLKQSKKTPNLPRRVVRSTHRFRVQRSPFKKQDQADDCVQNQQAIGQARPSPLPEFDRNQELV